MLPLPPILATLATLSYDILKNSYPVISTIPTGDGWDVQFVADKVPDKKAVQIEPTLEHAYVYFMEYISNKN